MLQIGNGRLTIEEDRAHFGLWALTKATLILGSKVAALSQEQLAIVSNKDLIAINREILPSTGSPCCLLPVPLK